MKYQSAHAEEAIVDTDEIDGGNHDKEWQLMDLSRSLESDCSLEIAEFSASKSAYWHSSAHILGSAIENVYDDALLTIGPPTKDGFFYDFYSPNGKVVQESDY